MKSVYKLFLIALGFIAIISCTNELANPEQDNDNSIELPDSEPATDGLVSKEFTAFKEGSAVPSVSSSAAKSALNDGATKVLWTADDKISVFGKEFNHGELSAVEVTDATAKFSGNVEAEGPYYAVTPYDEANALSEGEKLQVVVPTVQTPLAACGNVDPAALVAVGKADEDDNIYFYNVCGLLAFDLKDEAVTEIRLEGAEDDVLAGTATVVYSENPSVESAVSGNYVTLKPEGETFEVGMYYVSVLPGTLHGLTVTITKGEEKTVIYEVASEIEVNRSAVRKVLTSTENDYEYNGYITDVASLKKFIEKASESTEDNPVKGVILNDLDLTGQTIAAVDEFYGELDGRGHSIKNWANEAGSLIKLNYGTVKNLIIDESCVLTAPSEVTTSDFGALIAKQGGSGQCINCKNYADITIAPTSVAKVWRLSPMIGCNDQGYLEGCENHGNVNITLNDAQAYDLVVGGVVGYCKGKVKVGEVVAKNCKNSGNIVFQAKSTVKCNSIGGVFGATPVHTTDGFKNTGMFLGCENSGNVTYTIGVNSDGSYTNIGGVIGYCEGDLKSCKNSGKVAHSNNTSSAVACTRPAVGGVAGCVGYSMTDCENAGAVEFDGYTKHGASENFAGGCVRPAFGGVVGAIGSSADIEGSVLKNCDNRGTLTVTNHMVPSSENADRTEPMMGGIAGYARVAVLDCDNNSTGTVTVSSSGYYNCVGGVVGRVWGSNTMTNCSNAAAMALSTFGSGTNQGVQAIYGGVVGRAEKATTQCRNTGSMSLTNGDGPTTTTRTGGLIGYTKGGITKSYNSGNLTFTSIKGVSYIGGLVGYTETTISDECSNSGNLSSSTGIKDAVQIGGLVGYAGGTVSNKCTNVGDLTFTGITGKTQVGGLVGLANASISDNCSNSGNVTCNDVQAQAYIGGLIGSANTGANVENCTNSGNVNVTITAGNGYNYVGGIAGLGQALTNCTNSGNVTSTNKKVRLGGLAGQGGGAISGCYVLNSTITLKNASADSEVGGFAAYSNANISDSGFVGTVDNQSTTSTYTGGLVAAVRGKDNPIISNTYLSVVLQAANADGKNGLIYGGQYRPSKDCTITLGQANKTLKVLNSSTFRGAAVSLNTPVVGYITPNATYTLNIDKTYLEFVDSLPTENGSSNSSFQQGPNWNGTWN